MLLRTIKIVGAGPCACYTLRGRNPDILTCIANLSNDEVFPPPEFANRMLDSLAEAWDNHGQPPALTPGIIYAAVRQEKQYEKLVKGTVQNI